MDISMLIGLLGGLALFIYGMKQMSEGLQKTAGKKLRHLLASLTDKPIIGVLVGTGVTAVVQSSSATTVMVIGFVNAGLLTLAQSIGVIMGANIGTTVTAQLISFKLGDYAFHAIIIGVIAYLFFRNKKIKYMGQALLGFGILFLGLNTMSDAVSPLRDSVVFAQWMEQFAVYPILGILIGILVTVAVQSSSASFGILLGLVSVGAINYQVAIPIILGSNIGTTVTAILSSIGANLSSKRAAAAHFVFNVVGSLMVLIFIYFIPGFLSGLENFILSISNMLGTTTTTERMLANTHTVFNVLNTLIWFPFIGLFEKMLYKFVPGEDLSLQRGLTFVDERMLSTPSMALEQVKKEIMRMYGITQEMVNESVVTLRTADTKVADRVIEKEEIINEIEEDLLHFLTDLPSGSLSEEDVRTRDFYIALINSIESMADDADDLADLTLYISENKIKFSDKAIESLEHLEGFVDDMMQTTEKFIEEEDYDYITEILAGEEEMDTLQLEYRTDHMRRLKKGICDPNAGIIYLEAVEDIEHLTDQMADIAHSFMES
ncbi:MAG: Na/Pi cotransporter family protein [Bacillota bacterium]